ncbi:MAG: hypothetical protein QOI80_3663, partial [Solirubrobacteraceae bacterium]|nr:hypothetical protein [Solirubrobacteraceae bacterium]
MAATLPDLADVDAGSGTSRLAQIQDGACTFRHVVPRIRVLFALCGVLALSAPVAQASFPFRPQNGPDDYTEYRLPGGANQAPSDVTVKLDCMYASTPPAGSLPNQQELDYVRGAHLADNADVGQGWRTTTGRPDVTIAVLDSGIKWDDDSAMV